MTQDQDLRTALEPFADLISTVEKEAADSRIFTIAGFGPSRKAITVGHIRKAASAFRAAPPRPVDAERVSLQARYQGWMVKVCEGDQTDLNERCARAAEEFFELMQALHFPAASLSEVMAYTFARPVGEAAAEMGGAVSTLAALAEFVGLDMLACGETELLRVNTPEMIAKVRGKRSRRHGRGALPGLEADVVPASPAHSPDKAVTREGVAETVESILFDEIGASIYGVGPSAVGKAVERIIAALAPQPTGAEAGRGGGLAGWKLVPVEATDDMITSAGTYICEQMSDNDGVGVDKVWEYFLAATPTPPVSPTPDSTGPAGAALDAARSLLADLDRSLVFGRHDAVITATNASVKRLRAALTPSAPIAAPVRDDGARERARKRIQALGAALSRRDWSDTERAYEAIRDAHDRPEIYDAPLTVSPGEAQTQEGRQ